MAHQETIDALQLESMLWHELEQAREVVDAANDRSCIAYGPLIAELTPAQRKLARAADSAEDEVLGLSLSHQIAALNYALPHVATRIEALMRTDDFLAPSPPVTLPQRNRGTFRAED